MSLGKPCCFILLAVIVAFASAGTSEVDRRPDIPDTPKVEKRPAVSALVPSRNPQDLGRGRLLVASRQLADPNFAKTVILLVHYDDEGVVGLMLNRHTDLPVSQVLAQVEAAKNRSDTVYLGGPLETPSVFALFHSKEKLEKAEHVFGGVYWIAARTAMEQAIVSRPDPGTFRVYLGYAGWTADQLKNEVRLGGWFIFQADQQTVFNAKPDSLWRELIRKTELTMARSARAPRLEFNEPTPAKIGLE